MYRAADIALRHLCGTAHHSDKVSQYVSGIYTQQLKEAGLQASTG
ncbi:TPA: IS3 family transposase, partial [Escherichia coli]|nr:IS3 family transposase [Escherichia coli]HAJ0155490.1 IS3 family transposase [Escherichia coli]